MSPQSPSTRPALILDRDGVINHDAGFLHRIEECRFIDGIFEMTAAFAARGFAIVIASNQSGIGRGYYGEAEYGAFMRWMHGEFSGHGVTIAGAYHCPDHPTEGVGAYRRDNPWRKPGPGMILQAAADLSLDLAGSWVVGDRPSDVEAGRAAGVGTLVLFDPMAKEVSRHEDYWRVPRLAEVTGMLVRGLKPG